MLVRACRCGARVPLGERCPACTATRYKQEDRRRGSAYQRGYDKDWNTVRIQAFVRDAWRCCDCGWEPTIVRAWNTAGLQDLPPTAEILRELKHRANTRQRHLHGDHIQTIKERPDLRLVPSNIATRCSVCHDRRTALEHAFNRQVK